jgi:hypothetical protein
MEFKKAGNVLQKEKLEEGGLRKAALIAAKRMIDPERGRALDGFGLETKFCWGVAFSKRERFALLQPKRPRLS